MVCPSPDRVARYLADPQATEFETLDPLTDWCDHDGCWPPTNQAETLPPPMSLLERDQELRKLRRRALSQPYQERGV